MTTPLVPTKTLEERITSRLHESIGDLITDEDLKGMVSRGIETALFQGRKVEKRDTWGHSSTWDRPSVVDEQVALLLSTKMQDAVNQWLKDNPEKIQAAIDVVLKAGVGDSLLRALDNRFSGMFNAGVGELQNRGLLPRGL